MPQFTCMDSHVVLVVGGTTEPSPTVGLRANIRSFTSVCPDVDLAYIGGGERAATAFKRASEGTLTFTRGNRQLVSLKQYWKFLIAFSPLFSSTVPCELVNAMLTVWTGNRAAVFCLHYCLYLISLGRQNTWDFKAKILSR